MYELNSNPTMRKNSNTSNILRMIEKKKTLILIGVFTLCIMMFSFGIISTIVRAEKSPTREKLVASVMIEKGDSLWSIASEYITDEYADMNKYIYEIKKSNGLTSDTIHEGCYIIVPYYLTRN